MKAYYLLLVLVITSCGSDEIIPDGTKILSIQHSENPLGLLPKAKEWEEKIIYDNMGRIVKVTEALSPSSYRTFERDQLGRIVHILTFDGVTNSLLNRDSITYNNDSPYKNKLFNFSINSGDNLPLTFIYKYYYNTSNEVIRRETFFVATNQNIIVEKYFWINGDINRKELYRYTPNEFLAYEFFYEYDTKVNYKGSLPMYLNDPLNQTNNNIIKESFNDYYGDWEALCNPCITGYKYNASSLPYVINASWGSRIDITYE